MISVRKNSSFGLAFANILSLIAVTVLSPTANADAPVAQSVAPAPASGHIVAMRRLSEAQYRNSIADIFDPDISVAGRFEPVVRPVHELIASGARDAALSPSGLEQFDSMARNIAEQVFDDKHRSQFALCHPKDATKADAACANAVLTPLGRFLFRRPLTAFEQSIYVKMAGKAAEPTGSFYKGLELALSAMLVSPKFLYIIETAEADPVKPGALRLDNYSRATRLSFTIWNSTPNQMLLDAAKAGRLTNAAQLDVTVENMVNSPRFEQGVRAFFADMLLFERFDNLSKDPILFPYYNAEVGQAMPEQMLRTIVDELVTRNGDYRKLFTTNRTFMTRALGGLYRVPVHKSQGWEPYAFGPNDDRAGILGQAGFLAIYSQTGRSSPTLRGRAVRELLNCQPIPNPPGNVNFTAVQDTTNKAMPTARNRLSAHITDENCAGCHKLTDPIGLSLERFDGIGSFRTSENGAPIDPAGQMDAFHFTGASGLGKTLAESPDTTQCVASRALEYARAFPSDEDGSLVERLDKQFAADGYNIRKLFMRVATMPESYHVKNLATSADTRRTRLATQ